MTDTTRAVAVTGLGCLSAAGGNVIELTDALFAGRRSVHWRSVRGERYPVFQLDEQAVPPGYFDHPACKRCGLLAVAAAREALDNAGFTSEQLTGMRVGVCIGTTVGSAMNNEAFYREFRAGRMPGIEGVVLAAGFSGHGFMHGPIVGKLMTEEILDGRAHTVNIDDLRYERFAAGKDVAEFNII